MPISLPIYVDFEDADFSLSLSEKILKLRFKINIFDLVPGKQLFIKGHEGLEDVHFWRVNPVEDMKLIV